MFSNMKVGQKLFAAFSVAILVAVAIGTTAYLSLSKVSEQLDRIANVQLPNLEAIKAMDEGQTSAWGVANGLTSRLLVVPELRSAFYKEGEDAWKRMDEAWAKFESLPHSADTLERWKAFGPVYKGWRGETEAIIALAHEKDRLLAAGVSKDDPRVLELDRRALDGVVAMQ